jgi:hypothetical protein
MPAKKVSPNGPAIHSEAADKYIAVISMDYCGNRLYRGQIFTLRGGPNDEKLVRIRYARPLPGGIDTHTCATCGAQFIGLGELSGHGKEAHRKRPLTLEDADRFERDNDEAAMRGLDLSKTKASQEAA